MFAFAVPKCPHWDPFTFTFVLYFISIPDMHYIIYPQPHQCTIQGFTSCVTTLHTNLTGGVNILLRCNAETRPWCFLFFFSYHLLKVDMFSYGMVLYELLSGRRPTLGHHQLQTAKKLSKGIRPVLGSPEEVQFCCLHSLLTECWDTKPEKVSLPYLFFFK